MFHHCAYNIGPCTEHLNQVHIFNSVFIQDPL